MKFPIFLHLSIFAALVSLSTAAHCDDITMTDTRTSCPDRSKSPAPPCADQACAARAQKEMEAQLECHKKRMLELQAKAEAEAEAEAGK
jgi:hypothetical protein